MSITPDNNRLHLHPTTRGKLKVFEQAIKDEGLPFEFREGYRNSRRAKMAGDGEWLSRVRHHGLSFSLSGPPGKRFDKSLPWHKLRDLGVASGLLCNTTRSWYEPLNPGAQDLMLGAVAELRSPLAQAANSTSEVIDWLVWWWGEIAEHRIERRFRYRLLRQLGCYPIQNVGLPIPKLTYTGTVFIASIGFDPERVLSGRATLDFRSSIAASLRIYSEWSADPTDPKG